MKYLRGGEGAEREPKRTKIRVSQFFAAQFCHAARSAIAGRAAARKTRICNQLLINNFSEKG